MCDGVAKRLQDPAFTDSLNTIAERTDADEVTYIQMFGEEAVNSVLERGHNSATGAMVNNFVDAQFLQVVWPQELDNVRLLCDIL
jgi:hypothetical protein